MTTYTSRLRLSLQATGANTDTWGATLNNSVFDLIDDAIAGMASFAVTATDVTLTSNDGAADQARNAILNVSGTLTANRSVIVPAKTKVYLVINGTGGAFDLTVKTAAGTGVVVPQDKSMLVYCDGTNVDSLLHAITADTATLAATATALADTLAIAGGGTGATTASGARTNLGLGALAILSTINNSLWSGDDLAIEHGGTGASTASGARTALGLGALALLSTINNSNWSGTALAVANGGTGATTASGARTALGIGSMATRAVTISTSAPSGGSDGDIWLQYS